MTYGITHNLVQTKLYQLSIEKKDRRKSLYRFVDNVLADSQSCLNTLQGQALSGNQGDPDRSFEITALKDANNGNLMDFSKDSNGNLSHPATKEKLKNLGIDKFESLKFRYKTALPRTGQVVLTSKTVVKGLHEKSNREIIWEISGLKVETKTDSDNNTSQQVTLCQDSVPLKILCGDNVTGTGHLNGGGFVQSTATVDSGAYVSDKAVVCGNAKVKGTAKVFGNAQVIGNAEIKENALVYDNAKISGNAVISGNARVFDSAKVDGAKIYGRAKVSGSSVVEGNGIEIYGNAKVYGLAQIKDNAKIYTNAKVFDSAKVANNAKIHGNAKIWGSANVTGSAEIYGYATVMDNVEIGGSPKIYGNAEIEDNGRVGGTAIVRDDAWVGGNASVVYNAIIEDHAGIGDTAWAYKNSWLKDRAGVGGDAWVSGEDPNDRATVGGYVYTRHGVHGKCKCVMTKDIRYGCGNVVMSRSCSGTEICGHKNKPYLPDNHKKSPTSSATIPIRSSTRPYNHHYYRNGCNSLPQGQYHPNPDAPAFSPWPSIN